LEEELEVGNQCLVGWIDFVDGRAEPEDSIMTAMETWIQKPMRVWKLIDKAAMKWEQLYSHWTGQPIPIKEFCSPKSWEPR
jgi:hypothetical protein